MDQIIKELIIEKLVFIEKKLNQLGKNDLAYCVNSIIGKVVLEEEEKENDYKTEINNFAVVLMDMADILDSVDLVSESRQIDKIKNVLLEDI